MIEVMSRKARFTPKSAMGEVPEDRIFLYLLPCQNSTEINGTGSDTVCKKILTLEMLKCNCKETHQNPAINSVLLHAVSHRAVVRWTG